MLHVITLQMTSFLYVVEDVSPVAAYLIPALRERLQNEYVLDFDAKLFARSAAAADAHKRGRVMEAQQGVLASKATDVYTSPFTVESSEDVRIAAIQYVRIHVLVCILACVCCEHIHDAQGSHVTADA